MASPWVQDGKLLGIKLLVDGKVRTVWWRVVGQEFADYPYTFASVAAGASTGWIDLTNAQNTYILMPVRIDLIYHFFMGLYPTNSLTFIQYPANKDHNALTGYRPVSSAGIGAIRGIESGFNTPGGKSEFMTLRGLRPLLNIFNNSPFTITPQLHLYAQMYRVEGPYLAGHPAIGNEDYLKKLMDTGDARVESIYGIDPIDIPQDMYTVLLSLNGKLVVGDTEPATSSRTQRI